MRRKMIPTEGPECDVLRAAAGSYPLSAAEKGPLVGHSCPGGLASSSPPAALRSSKVLITEIPELGDGPPPLHVADVWSPGALLIGVRVDLQGFRPVVVVAAVGSRPPVRRNIRSITLRVAVDEYVAGERRHTGSSDRE